MKVTEWMREWMVTELDCEDELEIDDDDPFDTARQEIYNPTALGVLEWVRANGEEVKRWQIEKRKSAEHSLWEQALSQRGSPDRRAPARRM